MRFFVVILVGFIAGCQSDETLRAYGAANRIWHLTEIDGKPFPAHATIDFSERNRVSGRAPCNQYSAEMSAPYPWFDVGPILSTKMACPDLTAEAQYFSALAAMTLSEVSDKILILSTDDDRSMIFKAGD